MDPQVTAFFDDATNTASYVVQDPATKACAIIDSVLDYEPHSGRTATTSADNLKEYVEAHGLSVQLLLETHVHADHLTAAPYLQKNLGGQIGIGAMVTTVQETFATLFNVEASFQRDGSQFDLLFDEGTEFHIGAIRCYAMHTPGHTPACMTYVIGNAAFVGDTLFMPDYGTARADFPGGDARQLYRSIQKLFSLPEATRLFLCHDYMAPGRSEFCWETTVREQRLHNLHVRAGVSEDAFVALRTTRDAQLDVPRLLLPSVQVNMRAGHLPPPEENGRRYLKIPIDAL